MNMITEHELRQLRDLAHRFRAAIDACDKRRLPYSFTEFPSGSCGDTVLLLAKYLEKHGF